MKTSTLEKHTPDPRLRFDPNALGLEPAERAYFLRPTKTIAIDLIGTWLARYHQGCFYGACITETEAYLGINDAAAHSWRGRRTARVEPMYQEGGHFYVFLIYGMHHCANIVTQTAGIPEAVLLRAAEGPQGTPHTLLSGPGRLCKALGITTAHTGIDILKSSELFLFLPRESKPPIGTSVRIGVEYAGEAKEWPLRFYSLNSLAVSGPARLKPLTANRQRN